MMLVLRLVLGLACVAALLLVFAYWRAGQRAGAAEAAFPPQGQFVQVDGQQVHVVVEGSGPAVVLIHGASGNARDMTFQLSKLLAPSYQVFSVDRPGFGYSDPLPGPDGGSLEQQAVRLSQAVAELGATQPIVMGHSYGGAVALAWATYRPEALSGLVLVASVAQEWSTGIDTFYKVTGSGVGRWVIDPLLAAFVPLSRIESAVTSIYAPQQPPAGYVDHVGGALSLRSMSLWINAVQRRHLLPQIQAQAPRYTEIRVPVEAVHGDADVTVSLDIHMRPLQEQLPEMGLTVLPGVGHAAQNTNPEAVIAAIDRVRARTQP